MGVIKTVKNQKTAKMKQQSNKTAKLFKHSNCKKYLRRRVKQKILKAGIRILRTINTPKSLQRYMANERRS
jgi:hypothetical protein